MLWAYIDAFLCGLNIYFFYRNPNPLSLAVAVGIGLAAIISAIDNIK